MLLALLVFVGVTFTLGLNVRYDFPVRDLQYLKNVWADGTSCKPQGKCANEFSCRTDACEEFGIFDFVIVGGSKAGVVLANRLSENPRVRVLLLEAGREENEFSAFGNSKPYFQTSNYSWAYHTFNQSCGCLGMTGNRCRINKSKGLGSFTLFGDAYVRPNKKDFEKWRSPKWTYDECFKYFKKSENMLLGSIRSNVFNSFHGIFGSLPIGYSHHHWSIAPIILGNEEIGVRRNLDHNGPCQLGVSRLQVLTWNGFRVTHERAYLRDEVRNRKNLIIATKALATKIMFNGTKAFSLRFRTDNRCWTAYIQKELILSAGAFNNPQLLMLSGIGPRLHLKKHKIRVKKALPVGQNLIMPHYIDVRFRTNITLRCSEFERDIYDFINHEGMFTETLGKVISFASLSKKQVPDYMALYDIAASYKDCDKGNLTNNYSNVTNKLLEDVKPNDLIVRIFPLHQRVRGTVYLNSSDPTNCVDIDPQILAEPNDVAKLQKAIDHILKLNATKAFRSINATVAASNISACDSFPSERLQWHCRAAYLTGLYSDVYGTCKMGSVVNDDLLVHGVDNMRVVDESVIPTTVSSPFLNALETMIAEKIVQRIRLKNGC